MEPKVIDIVDLNDERVRGAVNSDYVCPLREGRWNGGPRRQNWVQHQKINDAAGTEPAELQGLQHTLGAMIFALASIRRLSGNRELSVNGICQHHCANW
jgi:hypothetical protein